MTELRRKGSMVEVKVFKHAAVWAVEGLAVDSWGCGFVRVLVITASETELPDAHAALRGTQPGRTWTQIDAVRLVKQVDGKYSPNELDLSGDLLHDQVKGRVYYRVTGKYGWVGKKVQASTEGP